MFCFFDSRLTLDPPPRRPLPPFPLDRDARHVGGATTWQLVIDFVFEGAEALGEHRNGTLDEGGQRERTESADGASLVWGFLSDRMGFSIRSVKINKTRIGSFSSGTRRLTS